MPASLRSRLLTGLAGLVGAFALYLLSIGPVGYVTIRTGVDPKYLLLFYAPAGWLIENTPLRQPMHQYSRWWSSRAIVHRNRQRSQTPPATPISRDSH